MKDAQDIALLIAFLILVVLFTGDPDIHDRLVYGEIDKECTTQNATINKTEQ